MHFPRCGRHDAPADADFLSEEIKNLRIFEDQEGEMNLSLLATRGKVLVVSQFTLYSGWRKGNRPLSQMRRHWPTLRNSTNISSSGSRIPESQLRPASSKQE